MVEQLFGNIGGSPVESLGNAGKHVLALSFDKVYADRELDDRGILLVALVANTSFMFGCVDGTALDGISGNVLELTGLSAGDEGGNILLGTGDIGAWGSTLESFGN